MVKDKVGQNKALGTEEYRSIRKQRILASELKMILLEEQ